MFSVISFLTIIPVRGYLEGAAKRSYLFPVVAVLIGIIVGVIGFLSFKYLNKNIAALLTLLSVYFVTGLMHIDGLADFSDAIMCTEKKERLVVMRDTKVGIAGFFSCIFVLLLTFFAIEEIGCSSLVNLIFAIITAEISAKLSMNTSMFKGKKAAEGIGAIFITHFSVPKYVISILISILIPVALAKTQGLFVVLGLLVGLFVAWIANNKIGCVTGDVMGASNEIARAVTLLAFMVI